MTEEKRRFQFLDKIRGKGKHEELNIDEEALREFEAVLHAELKAEDVEEEHADSAAESGAQPNGLDDEQENLDELEMEVERVRELRPEPENANESERLNEWERMDKPTFSEESERNAEDNLKETACQDSLPVRTPLEDSLQEQLEELEQIKSGLPEDRMAWIHEQAVRGANQDAGELHYRRRRRQPQKASLGKWIWIIAAILIMAAVWFFRGSILAALPSFERTETEETVDPEAQLRGRVELFFTTAKVIEAESMTSFFSMTTMNDPQNYEANRDAINALIDLKTSFELVQELQYMGISGIQMEAVDEEPVRATVSLELNSTDTVLKAALEETTWLVREGQWVLDAEQYLLDLREAQIALDQVPVLPKEDNSDLPAGEVVKDEPETPLAEKPSVIEETEDGFIQAGGYTYVSESDGSFTMRTLKFGIQREGFEKMVFTSAEAKADQASDAPSFEMWLSEDNTTMTVRIDCDLSEMEIANYKRFSALIGNIEVDEAEQMLTFTFKEAVQVKPYEWKGLLIMDYEEKE